MALRYGPRLREFGISLASVFNIRDEPLPGLWLHLTENTNIGTSRKPVPELLPRVANPFVELPHPLTGNRETSHQHYLPAAPQPESSYVATTFPVDVPRATVLYRELTTDSSVESSGSRPQPALCKSDPLLVPLRKGDRPDAPLLAKEGWSAEASAEAGREGVRVRESARKRWRMVNG